MYSTDMSLTGIDYDIGYEKLFLAGERRLALRVRKIGWPLMPLLKKRKDGAKSTTINF